MRNIQTDTMTLSGRIKRWHRLRKNGSGCSCGSGGGFGTGSGHRERGGFQRGPKFQAGSRNRPADHPYMHHAPAVLNQMMPGDAARVVEIDDGRGFRAKLLAMGLTPGRIIRCIRKNGPNVVCLRLEGQDTEIFINRMMAERIGVEPITAETVEEI